MAIWRERIRATPTTASRPPATFRRAAGGRRRASTTASTASAAQSRRKVAMDAAGNAIAVWHQPFALLQRVQRQRRLGRRWRWMPERREARSSSPHRLVMTPAGRGGVEQRLTTLKSMPVPGAGFGAPGDVAPTAPTACSAACRGQRGAGVRRTTAGLADHLQRRDHAPLRLGAPSWETRRSRSCAFGPGRRTSSARSTPPARAWRFWCGPDVAGKQRARRPVGQRALR